MTAIRIRIARWLVKGTGYHLRASRKAKTPSGRVSYPVANVEPIGLTWDGTKVNLK